MMKRWIFLIAVLLMAGWPRTVPVRSHEGPPFPIFENKSVGPYTVAVWTDPDIGIGTFYVMLDVPRGQDFPEPTRVEVAVQPVSGRLAEVAYRAEPQHTRSGTHYYTEVAFDQGEFWHVRVRIESPQGGGTLETQVEATPDGTIGPIGLLVYLLPFLAVAFLWLKAYLRRREHERQTAASGG